MQDENLKSQVWRLYRAFGPGAMDSPADQLSSTSVAHLVGLTQPLDREGFKQFGLAFYRAFAKGWHRFDKVIVAADGVITWGAFTATHQGSFQGLLPTGKAVCLAVMPIDRVADGKIVESWGQGASFLRADSLALKAWP